MGRRNTSIGPMSKKSAAVPHFIAPRVTFDPSHRITNAGTTGTYSQAEAHRNAALRPGCLDFLAFSSRGQGC